ncbi:glutamate-rich protein 1-like [Sinocyclocheilus grahami]|uniref:Glutamate-rich protein 1-like n=1 Tax=Sinocyclocheilus grahami TaxID=75366 RepID=A0A672P502_SINGR|nr:PREDICTED: glutamate-rich protein 1-like [Sinocyclocheilus grahami]XP_016124611.1 PREDICTED: glutamate-rich protein 1-like [Sinocyclocheilus grahami]XP_016124618.1 PREDICTED: glutamate-rich protein 1-like [Sinocyclocheilus grahami]XP_016124626.1 PREDICTED: glutamate-rich protein 1-like [Sinocyclocheilus grahami]
MSLRKEVFQSKVLQRLYPAAQKQSVLQPAAQEWSIIAPVPPVERPQSITPNKSGNEKSTAVPGKKLYTVLPPPEGYLNNSEEDLVTPSNPDPIDSEDSPADADDYELLKRRKRRRKKKGLPITTEEVSTPPTEGDVLGQTDAAHPSDEVDTRSSVSTERLSKNRKRKMKKKRHKEKVLTLGLMPRARAVEFMYAQSGDGNSEEVLNFLRTTQEIYLSDRKSSGSCVESGPSLSLTAAEALFSRLSGRTLPPAEISRLCGLRAVLVKNEEQLKSKLQEFRDTSTLLADEVSVVCTLIEYWLAEILPMQRPQRT